MLRLAQRPHPISHSLISFVLTSADHSARPAAMQEWADKVDSGVKLPGVGVQSFGFFSQLLLDALWLKFDGVTPVYNGSVVPIPLGPVADLHPELYRDHAHTGKASAGWYGFFLTVLNATTSPTLDEVVGGALFLPGSFTHHWHNRYDLGVGVEHSWARILNERFKGMAWGKTVCGEES